MSWPITRSASRPTIPPLQSGPCARRTDEPSVLKTWTTSTAKSSRCGVLVGCYGWLLKREACFFPSIETAPRVRDVGKTFALKNAGRDRTAIAAFAVDDRRPRFVEIVESAGEPVERPQERGANDAVVPLRG